jgi:hypothetical protein
MMQEDNKNTLYERHLASAREARAQAEQLQGHSSYRLAFSDDDFLMAKRINADSKGNIKSIINMEDEIRKGFSKGCYRLNSPCD